MRLEIREQLRGTLGLRSTLVIELDIQLSLESPLGIP
jgi:hypothetical protein